MTRKMDVVSGEPGFNAERLERALAAVSPAYD